MLCSAMGRLGLGNDAMDSALLGGLPALFLPPPLFPPLFESTFFYSRLPVSPSGTLHSSFHSTRPETAPSALARRGLSSEAPDPSLPPHRPRRFLGPLPGGFPAPSLQPRPPPGNSGTTHRSRGPWAQWPRVSPDHNDPARADRCHGNPRPASSARGAAGAGRAERWWVRPQHAPRSGRCSERLCSEGRGGAGLAGPSVLRAAGRGRGGP